MPHHYSVLAVYRVVTQRRGTIKVAKKIHVKASDRVSAFAEFLRRLTTAEMADLHRAEREDRISILSAHRGAPYVEFNG